MKYMGVLGNVDASICNVRLEHGFVIEAMPFLKWVEFFSALRGVPYNVLMRDIFIRSPAVYSAQMDPGGKGKPFSDMECYFVSRTFETNFQIDDQGHLTGELLKEIEPCIELVQSYLDPKIALMRLYKEGNIRMLMEYYYTVIEQQNKEIVAAHAAMPVVEGRFTLTEKEVGQLERFIQTASLPLQPPFVELALRNFELSYQVNEIGLSFVAAMIGMEILFDAGAQKVARNAAVLLGVDKQNSTVIFKELRQLHEKRSKFVHSGKASKLSKEDVKRIRFYLRESIKKTSAIGIRKEELLQELNTMAFGDGSKMGCKGL